MKYILSLILFFTNLNLIPSQNSVITGKIKDYSSGEAEIILPVRDPIALGSITKKGKFTIDLNESVIEAIHKDNDKLRAERGDKAVRNTTVKRAFYCDTEDVITSNGEEIIESFTIQGNVLAGIIKDKKPIGKLRLSSSKAFGDSYFSYGKKDFETGYYIDFYYVNNEASVNGICKTKTYTLDMKNTFNLTHNYNINLKKGWNIVKIEVEEVYTDQEGHVRPLKYRMSTIDKLPKDVNYIFTPGEKL
ncbi:hypothetical protein [Aestuariivivens sediminis]|uniref:hypothetical protein n=1 Tax=Aestuariivivens sediminis TaxID=2913557 RepID=UPI001F56A69D|nr:hypothetical protein [Aestuariivivens sediminis]